MASPIRIGFVCQAGRLEAQSCLLAASLRKYLGNEIPLTAAIAFQEPDAVPPSSDTLNFLESLDVSTHRVANPISKDYPIGNKLACLRLLESDSDKAVFLDSDMLVLGDFRSALASNFDFMAKPADLSTSGLDEKEWIELMARHGIQPPRSRYQTTHDMRLGIPYFNAGFIAVAASQGLSETWISHATNLARERGGHDYHLDQISLTLALAERSIAIRPIGEYLNFPSHLRPLTAREPVKIVHYHHPESIIASGRARDELAGLLQDNSSLRTILKSDPEWSWVERLSTRKTLARLRRSTDRKDTLNFIITGIPRSGTSLYASALEDHKTTIVINEPPEIFHALTRPGHHGLAVYYQRLRGKILKHEAVQNKIDTEGQLVEDTTLSDVRREIAYTPRSPRFRLGTKNTLAYLSRLEQIASTMPDCAIFCCIRNPVSTIASWMRSFDHLRAGEPGQALIGTSSDALLSHEERLIMASIETQEELAIKRALWWNFLANRILRNLDRIVLVKYEDFIADSGLETRRARRHLGLPRSRILARYKVFRNLTEVDRSSELSAFELECIRGICATTAARFGYEI